METEVKIMAWERVARVTPGETTQTPLYPAVGKAVEAWTNVMDELPMLMDKLIGSGMAYRGVWSLNDDVAQKAAQIRFLGRNDADIPQSTKDRIIALANSLDQASQRWGDIAHGRASSYTDGNSTPYFYWMPSPNDGLRMGSSYPESYLDWWTSAQILNYAGKFGQLRTEVLAVIQLLGP